MGIQQINKQQLPVAIGIAVIVVVMLGWIFYTLFSGGGTKSAGTDNQGNLDYTSAITGKKTSSFPAETIEPEGAYPRISIDGGDVFERDYNTDRVLAIQDKIDSFVAALSNSQAEHTDVINRKLRVSGNTGEFQLFVDRPESTYDVTITFTNDGQVEPDMTFTKVED